MSHRVSWDYDLRYSCPYLLAWLLLRLQQLVLKITGYTRWHGNRGRHLQVFTVRPACHCVLISSSCNFYSFFHSFEKLDYLLKDNVSLYSLDADSAYFVEVPEHVDVYSSDTTPRLSNAQFEHAIKIIHVPLKYFLEFTDKLPTDHTEIIYLPNHGRCGSTIVTQVFERTGLTLTLDEPGVLGQVCNEPELMTTELVGAVFKALAKPMVRQPKAVVIKPTSWSINLVPIISNALPKVKHLYIYRNGRATVSSFIKTLFDNPAVNLPETAGKSLKVIPRFPSLTGAFCEMPNMEVIQCLPSLLTWQWASSIHLYKKYREDGVSIVAVKYDDFVGRPHQVITEMLSVMDLPTSCVDDSLRALEQDSQRGLAHSRQAGRAGSVPLPQYDVPEVKLRCDTICDYLQVPRLDQPISLPGSLTGAAANSFE